MEQINDVFMDGRGKIRCKGRMKNLSNTTFDMSYPILLETPLARLFVLDVQVTHMKEAVKISLTT